LAWSPDGKRILTCSIDITARIWDAVSGQQIRLFVGHEDNVRAAAWSPDGKRIITGSDDRTARIWDVDTAQALSTLSGHDVPVWAVGWSPKGDQVITGSFDKTARLWVADSHIMVAGLSQYICGHFTDTQIRTEISAWQGCTAELATMTQDR
jgi:WD40 repeat protein